MAPRRFVLALAILGLGAGVATMLLWRGGCFDTPTIDPLRDHPENTQLDGRVTDQLGPVPGARIRVKGQSASVDSDAQGRFRLVGTDTTGRITAWKNGYFIGGLDLAASPLEFTLKKLPAEDCTRYSWVDPAPIAQDVHACGKCHDEIYREWSVSAHARSASGRHFRNLYDGTDWNGKAEVGWSLKSQYPRGAGVCASCHAPTAEVAADLNQIDGVAKFGVHCDYCHKISGVGEGPIGRTHGRFNLDLLRPAEGQLFFGPLDDVDRGEDAFSPLYKESKYCASCHEGTVFGVHVYSTYSEWLVSPAKEEGKQCQTCHMKPTGTMTNMAPNKGGIERDPKTLANHRLFAGSQEEMLRQCVKLSARLERDADGVKTMIEVGAENVGHRVPTGFIDRHLILVVEALDSNGKSMPLGDGPSLPGAVGKLLAGKPGKLYAKLLNDEDGHSPAPFWLADPEPVDTRLTEGKPDSSTFRFAKETRRIRVRVIYRRFWREVAEVKQWPDDEIVIVEKILE